MGGPNLMRGLIDTKWGVLMSTLRTHFYTKYFVEGMLQQCDTMKHMEQCNTTISNMDAQVIWKIWT